MLTAQALNTGSKHVISVDFPEWIAQEKSQILPLFIWDSSATEEEQKIFEKQVIPIISGSDENIGEFYIVGAYNGSPKKQDYHNGEIILTMKSSGYHIQFDLADVVTFAQGKWWLCGLMSHLFDEPFALTSDLKKIIRQKRYAWADIEKTYLDSKDLRELASALKVKQS